MAKKIHYVKDLTVTGNEDNPQSVLFENLQNDDDEDLEQFFRPPFVSIISVSQDIGVYLTSDPKRTYFTIARSNLGDISGTVKCNLKIIAKHLCYIRLSNIRIVGST